MNTTGFHASMAAINLDDVLKVAQIAFYLAGTTVAVLTYVKAKNGLLNAVNTEYKKRVMDRLAEVARDLLEEYDFDSAKHWSRVDSVKQVLAQLHENIAPHKEKILETGQIDSGIPMSSKAVELFRMANVIRSDPFIPRPLRDRLVDFFQMRFDVMTSVYIEEIGWYKDRLKEGKYWDTLETNRHWFHNRILGKLMERGCGISQIEEEVHQLRDAIQKYFDQFDPIKG